MEQEGTLIFGSKTRTMILEELAKATQPISASSIARVGGIDAKNVYEEFNKFRQLGIFQGVPIGKKQNGYTYSDKDYATKLKEFVKLMLEKRISSIIDRIAAFFPITDYYISLPVSLRVPFDAFYSPNYLLLFVDETIRSSAEEFVKSLGSARARLFLKPVSLWGREFRYDEIRQASLATNEQAIADGLNYYDEIRDREVIRTLVTRATDIDMDSVITKLDKKGVTRLLAILTIKNAVLQDVERDLLDLVSNRARVRLKGPFKQDLEREVVPLLLSNDKTDNKVTFDKTVSAVEETMKKLGKLQSGPIPLQVPA